MLSHSTIDRLRELGLVGMVHALEEQRRQPDSADLSFEDRLAMLVDREVLERDNKRLKARLRFAGLRQIAAPEDVDYRAHRSLDRAMFQRLAQGEWIERQQNLLITGTAKGDARLAFQDASKAETSLRERIMLSVADLSQAGRWTPGEIAQAAAKAAAMSNSASEKALANFIGETKRAMDPNVRGHVPALVNLRDLCWNTETEMLAADKSSPKPLRKAFVRQYHMLIRMFAEAQKGRVFTKASDVIAWAKECDPDLDLDKVMARLERIKGELSAFYSDWPVDDIRVCVAALGDVDKKALKTSRPAVVSNVVPIVPPTVGMESAVETTGMAEGACDILDDVLQAA